MMGIDHLLFLGDFRCHAEYGSESRLKRLKEGNPLAICGAVQKEMMQGVPKVDNFCYRSRGLSFEFLNTLLLRYFFRKLAPG
jgi:hypothetical protein